MYIRRCSFQERGKEKEKLKLACTCSAALCLVHAATRTSGQLPPDTSASCHTLHDHTYIHTHACVQPSPVNPTYKRHTLYFLLFSPSKPQTQKDIHLYLFPINVAIRLFIRCLGHVRLCIGVVHLSGIFQNKI